MTAARWLLLAALLVAACAGPEWSAERAAREQLADRGVRWVHCGRGNSVACVAVADECLRRSLVASEDRVASSVSRSGCATVAGNERPNPDAGGAERTGRAHRLLRRGCTRVARHSVSS